MHILSMRVRTRIVNSLFWFGYVTQKITHCKFNSHSVRVGRWSLMGGIQAKKPLLLRMIDKSEFSFPNLPYAHALTRSTYNEVTTPSLKVVDMDSCFLTSGTPGPETKPTAFAYNSHILRHYSTVVENESRQTPNWYVLRCQHLTGLFHKKSSKSV